MAVKMHLELFCVVITVYIVFGVTGLSIQQAVTVRRKNQQPSSGFHQVQRQAPLYQQNHRQAYQNPQFSRSTNRISSQSTRRLNPLSQNPSNFRNFQFRLHETRRQQFKPRFQVSNWNHVSSINSLQTDLLRDNDDGSKSSNENIYRHSPKNSFYPRRQMINSRDLEKDNYHINVNLNRRLLPNQGRINVSRNKVTIKTRNGHSIRIGHRRGNIRLSLNPRSGPTRIQIYRKRHGQEQRMQKLKLSEKLVSAKSTPPKSDIKHVKISQNIVSDSAKELLQDTSVPLLIDNTSSVTLHNLKTIDTSVSKGTPIVSQTSVKSIKQATSASVSLDTNKSSKGAVTLVGTETITTEEPDLPDHTELPDLMAVSENGES